MRWSAVLVLTVTLASTACGSSNESTTDVASATVDGASVAVGAAPLPGGAGLGDAVAVVAAAPGEASDAACDTDRRTLELAAETYELLTGSVPTSQQELLDAQIVRELSVRFEITDAGVVVPAPASPCR